MNSSHLKKALVMNFFPAFVPPSSGGELRYFNLYQQLSAHYDITLLSPTYNDHPFKIITHSETFREYRVPKQDIHNKIHWQLDQKSFSSEVSALVCALAGEYETDYHKHYLTLHPTVDFIIHEFPYMLNYDLFFGIDNKPRIYNSHNLEYDLVRQTYKVPAGQSYIDYVYTLERRLVQYSDLVFATSEEEKAGFSDLYHVAGNKIRIAPNGINPEELPTRSGKIDQTTALFIGSAHPPNIEAVDFIINRVADQCRDITFIIAGSCGDTQRTDKDNVRVLGRVDDNQKQELFRTSGIAINPMFSGAGTNLKTLEFLSMGMPMVSTEVGVRGLDLTEYQHFIRADKDSFSEKVRELMFSESLRKRLSEKSKSHVNRKYAWPSISETVHLGIAKIVKNRRKTVLILNDFEVSNPLGGGEVRINKLYAALSNKYNIVLVCLNSEGVIKTTFITQRFLEISVPKTKQHVKEGIKVNTMHWVGTNDIVSSYMVNHNNLYLEVVKSAFDFADLVVLLHPYMYKALTLLPDGKPICYESLNFEFGLKQKLLKDHPRYKTLIKHVDCAERECCKMSKFIISVSDDDHRGLKSYVPDRRIYTICNGVDIDYDPVFTGNFSKIKRVFSGYPVIIFIGSAHVPNVTGARFILNNLAIELPECYFIIVGSVCDTFYREERPKNVLLVGTVEIDVKNVLFRIADVAINPVTEGSGSNLKLGDYFAWGIPSITTPFGARGYNIKDGIESVICDLSLFKRNILYLMRNRGEAKRLAENALTYVNNNLDWNLLAKKYSRLLEYEDKSERKKLLIVTYRFTVPPLGGAEIYLYELLKLLDRLDDYDITLACLDLYDIVNEYHFSTDFSRNSCCYQNELLNVIIKNFPADHLSREEKRRNSRALMKIWINEFVQSARKFVSRYDRSLLMGGWNFPEKIRGCYQIWSSEKSDIYLHDSQKIRILGFSPTQKLIRMNLNNKVVYENKVKSKFTIQLENLKDGILSIECDETYVGDDIRPLGLLINDISINDEYSLHLNYCYRDFLKDLDLSAYIDEMISIAQARSDDTDKLFQKTRGPNSGALERWLSENISSFDMVLGHSIPFATVPLAARYARAHHVPYTVLPHFHYDDEFYHWQSYYDALQNAHKVFAFPSISVPQFYDKLNIPTVGVPGGGIEPKEYQNVTRKKFRRQYYLNKPFFLVLGRKSGAKNYKCVIDAMEKLNTGEHICNLVMIGRDEDQTQINSKYAFYLGEQPREIVLGALKDCLGLITMSRSESFGIVILEAWMFSKPVIVNEDCPAYVELVQNEENGLHAGEHNLVEKMNRLLSNADLTKRLGATGNEKVERYTWENIAAQFESTFSDLLSMNSKLKTQNSKTRSAASI